MRRGLSFAITALVLVGSMSGCASTVPSGSVGSSAAPIVQTGAGLAGDQTHVPATAPDDADPVALAQVQAWLDAADLPPGAIRSQTSLGGFSSYTGWPCEPVVEMEAFWTIGGMTVTEAAIWFRENPTADLVSTSGGPLPDDPTLDNAIIGYTPADLSQQGVVYTVAKTSDGVAVRAEIAALTATAVCPAPPGGGVWGLPGQG